MQLCKCVVSWVEQVLNEGEIGISLSDEALSESGGEVGEERNQI